MEKIIKHIEKLLAQYDYVIVPEFGGFVVQQVSSIIEGEKITPPLATVGFNPLIQHSDGLLAIEIARFEGVSYRNAIEIIHNEVEKYISELSLNKSIQFGELGFFTKDVASNLIFEPTKFASFLPLNLGLNHVYFASNNTIVKSNRTVSFTLPTYQTFRNIAAVFLVLIGLFVFSPQLNKVNYNQSASLFPILTVINQTNSVQVTDSTKCSEFVETIGIDGELLNNDSDLQHVIVASLGSRNQANDYCETLRNNGYECSHVLNHSKIFRVAIKSFQNKSDAILYMETLRKSAPDFESAWVLCK